MSRVLSARHLFVGGMLRRYREAIGFSLASAARVLGLDQSSLSRVEQGRRTISRSELLWLLEELGASEEAEQALATIAADLSVWWRKYASSLPSAYVDLAAFLTCAEKITVFESRQIPLLLQTPSYSQILASADRALSDRASLVLPGMVEDLQKEIVESGEAALQFLIGEAALRNHVGDGDTMRDQLAQLDIGSGTSDLRVIPLSSTPNPAFWTSSLTFIEFPAEVESVVHLGGPGGGTFLLAEDDVAPCAQMLSELGQRAGRNSSGSLPEGATA